MENQKRNTRNNRGRIPISQLKLTVAAESVPFFATLLQYGVEIESPANIPLGTFLSSSPGFSEEYLLETVQTIFLDGTAIDDLGTPLTGPHPVVALSAAMPGLAGAIFRKNGLHSTLRTPPTAPASNPKTRGPMTVTLKLFNRIARDKGALLLSAGAVMASSSLADFLLKRTELIDKIIEATLDSEPVTPEKLAGRVRDHEFLRLFVSSGISPC